MKSSKRLNLALFASFIGCTLNFSEPAAGQLAQTMTHIKIRMLEPAPKPGTYAAEPKEYWRSRKVFARVAEGPDNAMKIHQLMIVNEPDIWLLEQMSKRGKHIVDPGPKYEVHISMFDRALKDLGDLEYGNEIEFFKSHKAKESAGPVINGKPTTRMELAMLDYKMALIVDNEKQVPLRFNVQLPDKKSYALEYMVYETLKFDPALFKAPSGFQLEEIKPTRPKRTEPVVLPVPPAPSKGTAPKTNAK